MTPDDFQFLSVYEQVIPDLFDGWWQESFPFAPANKQTRENFIAFAKYVSADITRALATGSDAAN